MRTAPPRRRRAPLAVILGCATALAACTGDTPAPDPDGAPGPRPLVAGDEPLEPGTYLAEGFTRPFSFRVERETWIPHQVERDIVTLIGPRTEVQISTPRLVFEKGDPLVPRPAPLPDDFVRWLAERPDLRSTAPRPDTVAGLRATTLEVVVEELYEEAELLGCPLPCFPLAPAGGPEPLFLTHTHRVTVARGDPPLVVTYGTGDRAGERAARALLESLRFTGSTRGR